MGDSLLTPAVVPTTWKDKLDEQQRKAVAFARVYRRPEFQHRIPGASDLTLIALLADLLDEAEKRLAAAGARNRPGGFA